MVTAGDFRNGMTIQMDGSIWQVIEFQHVKPGKGSPFVRTKLKNIINGGVVENSYLVMKGSPVQVRFSAYITKDQANA